MVKVFGIDAVFRIAWIVAMLSTMVVWERKKMKTQLAMKVEWRLSNSEFEGKYCSESSHIVFMITTKTEFT